jgi:hypothetical protein
MSPLGFETENNANMRTSMTHRIIESSPFSVDNHVATLLSGWAIAELGDIRFLSSSATWKEAFSESTYQPPRDMHH